MRASQGEGSSQEDVTSQFQGGIGEKVLTHPDSHNMMNEIALVFTCTYVCSFVLNSMVMLFCCLAKFIIFLFSTANIMRTQ